MCAGWIIAAAPVFFVRQITSSYALTFDASGETLSAKEPEMLSGSTETVRVADTSLMETRTRVYETRVLSPQSFSVPEKGSALFADLREMMIRYYRDGKLEKEFPIVSKGKPGSLWETPTGSYNIKTKEENHYSTIGRVWMPHSMQFFGNFFVHGWPHYADGSPVPQGFSGGCVRLSETDAKELFSLIEVGTPLFVTNGAEPALVLASGDIQEDEQLGYRGAEEFSPPPAISGEAALVGDLENSFLFYEKNSERMRSIASLSKLMTALISLEAENQFETVVITEDDVTAYGEAGGLRAGDRMAMSELLWPLLLSSSNDAAYAIARQLGFDQFVRLMNEKNKSLGLTNTIYREPSGLDPENQSTALDMFKLVQHLWNNKRSLVEMTSERSHKAWRNIHPFVSKNSFEGGKTGFIPEAKKTIVSIFSVPMGEFDERHVAVVVLGSENLQSDVERLRIWVKQNFEYGLESPLESQQVEYAVNDLIDPSGALSLLFTGDIMMNRGVEEIIREQGNNDWSFPFSYVSDVLGGADITFGNLEGPVSDAGVQSGSEFSFRMDPHVTTALALAGFDIVSLANNHMGDWGREAFEDTMRRLQRSGIAYAGGGWNQKESLEPAVFEVRGKRVGFVAFSDVGPLWMQSKDALSGIAALPAGSEGKEYVEKAVFEASQKVDILVVSFHFGEEYQTAPNERQKELARTAVDAGARVVIGHHPHVVENIEEYGKGVIAYSLGNFIFDQNFSADTMEGLMLKVEFDGDAIAAVIPIPVRMNEYYQPKIE
ncbi:MAG: poly-gamma-glutamate synthesis protein (capsule biosynthesis protein) [Parcubacteria group bacterium Gr01-1014_70]|nr:MAG: poly-gamma-glutamate synthesis protein (capsule biosynthesis protein) [Parcubacteria group bacterium Gr01-1014_70]